MGLPLLTSWSGGSRPLRQSGTDVEYHKYKSIGHGFGLGTGTIADGWIFEAIRFWEASIRNHR
jgi:hypothetical protein